MKYSLAVACLVVLSSLDAVEAQTPLLRALKGLPDVAHAEQASSGSGERFVIHLRDWHWVAYDELKTDRPALTIDNYLDFLDDVTAVQAEQYRILKQLLGLKDLVVYREGVTPELAKVMATVSRSVWAQRRKRPDDIELLILTPNVLTLGMPGRLLAEQKIKRVFALDTEESLRIANPFDETGKRRSVPETAIEAREDIMVRQLLKTNGTAVVVLGGDHDLRDNLKRLAPHVDLIVVTTKHYQKASQE